MHPGDLLPNRLLRPTSVHKRAALLQRETAKPKRSEYQMKTTIQCWLLYGIAAVIALGGLAGCGSDSSGTRDAVQIRALSNRADLVSGGNAYVEIVLTDLQGVGGLSVNVDGRDVTSAFAIRSDGRMKGVITGLANGDNVVTASVTGAPAGRLTINNHPIGGPVLLSAQTTPWVCATPLAVPASGNTPGSNASGLSTAAVDVQCNIATEFKLFYRTTSAGCSLGRLPDAGPAGTHTPGSGRAARRASNRPTSCGRTA